MRKYIFLISLFFVLAGAAYVYAFYYYPFSDGGRAGQLIKFSKKGMAFKTYEGVMVQAGLGRGGSAGSIQSKDFHFSVCDNAIADSLGKLLNKEVELHYVQYKKSLPWRGDNYNDTNEENGQYIIDRIIKVEEPMPIQNTQPEQIPTANSPQPMGPPEQQPATQRAEVQ